MRRLTDRGVTGSLFRYQLMANIVGTLIIPLFIFTGIKLASGHCKLEVEIFGVTCRDLLNTARASAEVVQLHGADREDGEDQSSLNSMVSQRVVSS